MRLREWAKLQGVHYQTAWKWANDGKMPVPITRTPSGTILFELPRPADQVGRSALYARVSSHDQRADLDRQLARLTEWAAQGNAPVVRGEAEVGAGMNGGRRT